MHTGKQNSCYPSSLPRATRRIDTSRHVMIEQGILGKQMARRDRSPLGTRLHTLRSLCTHRTFCTPTGGNGTRGEANCAISPLGCTKRHGTQITSCNNCNMIIHLLKVLLSSSNINYDEYATVGTTKDIHRLTRVTRHGAVQPWYMRICCTSRDWYSTNQTAQFVTEI